MNYTVTVHRPALDEQKREARERELRIALEKYGKAMMEIKKGE